MNLIRLLSEHRVQGGNRGFEILPSGQIKFPPHSMRERFKFFDMARRMYGGPEIDESIHLPEYEE